MIPKTREISIEDSESLCIENSILLHLTKPWVPNYLHTLIRPVDDTVSMERAQWFGQEVKVVSNNNGSFVYPGTDPYLRDADLVKIRGKIQRKGEISSWFLPTMTFWEDHVNTCHSGGFSCGVDLHRNTLSGTILWYATVTTNGKVSICDRNDFQIECAYFQWIRRLIE